MSDEHRFPKSYQRATWRGCIPGGDTESIGISLDPAGGGPPARFRLSTYDARRLADAIYACLARTGSHSPISSGKPQVEGSTPEEGKNV